MKILMIGLGSIGKRHLKNTVRYCEINQIDFVADALRSSRNKLPEEIEELLTAEYYEMDNIANDYDIIFITNPTYLHYDTMKAVQKKTKHIFVEKPVFMKPVEDNDLLFQNVDSVYYVACPLRHSNILKQIKKITEAERVFSVRAICSSYLPEWRKEADYRTVYSSKKELGGGVKLDLIHEWDYLVWLFGFPEGVKSFEGKYSDLEMNVEDLAVYIAEYSDKVIELHLDYFGRETKRQIELRCKEYTILADIIHNTISYISDEKSHMVTCDQNDIYYSEIEYFMGLIAHGGTNINSMRHANEVLWLACGNEGH